MQLYTVYEFGHEWKYDSTKVCRIGAYLQTLYNYIPDSKVHGANTGPTWVLSATDGLHVGPMNLTIRDVYLYLSCSDKAEIIRKDYVNAKVVYILSSIVSSGDQQLWYVCV